MQKCLKKAYKKYLKTKLQLLIMKNSEDEDFEQDINSLKNKE